MVSSLTTNAAALWFMLKNAWGGLEITKARLSPRRFRLQVKSM